MLNWIFLISALNFSFWSEKEGTGERYGVEWQASWTDERKVVYTGYWSLVAALNRGKKILMSPDDVFLTFLEALKDDGIPITDPSFYASEELCPDYLIEATFRPAAQSTETIPLLKERIKVMREVGKVLCEVLIVPVRTLSNDLTTSKAFPRILQWYVGDTPM